MTNRLAGERSPYLLQHADNPVHWRPWSPGVFDDARRLDRPVLLSVGYSACHWCHVMERESFADPATAELMNARFVSVKVDREERPDVDAVYMKAVQALTGRGGWPLTVFLTPDGEPFYGGTYYPPRPRHGLPSFRQVLQAVADAWENRRDEVTRNARGLTEALERSATGDGGGAEAGTADAEAAGAVDGARLARGAARHLAERFDESHGGFGGAPKFPQPTTLEFLLAHGVEAGDEASVERVVRTLRAMAAGGIRDHLAGGFHRYSVDARWLVPHFEKMLYDNALLARLYLDAWRATGANDLRAVAEETLDWILADLTSPGGGFYAARDADSEGEEGLFYLWTPEEVDAAAPDAGGARLFRRLYGVEPGGNFEGRSILHLPHAPAAVARSEGMTEDGLRERLEPVRRALLEARGRREPPFRDEKILASWSAFTVRSLAEAGALLDRPDYLDAARAGARFVLDALVAGDGAPLHVWIDGEAGVPALLEDRAALGNALLTLHEATLEPGWLAEVERVCDDVAARFWDDDRGLFHDTPVDGEALVVRPREVMDQATPSGTALAVELLLRAGHLFDRDGWTAVARRALDRESAAMARFPGGFGRLLTQRVRADAPPVEVAVMGPRQADDTRALLRAALRPYRISKLVTGGDPRAGELPDLPVLRGRGMVDGAAAAFVCRAYACEAPTSDPEAVAATLAEVSASD